MANQSMGVKVKKLAGIILGVAIGLSGCGGSGTNNDQGTSFLALGYFTDATGSTGLTGVSASVLDFESSLGVVAYMGLQNRLSSQFIRVDQISCGYEVPGSSVSLYQDSFNSSFVLGPSGTTGGVTESIGYAGFHIISKDVIAYFANRLNELPALPFRVNVQCFATGISQSGDVFQSNPLGFQLILTDDATVVEEDASIIDESILDENASIDDIDDDNTSSSSSSSSSGTSSL